MVVHGEGLWQIHVCGYGQVHIMAKSEEMSVCVHVCTQGSLNVARVDRSVCAGVCVHRCSSRYKDV